MAVAIIDKDGLSTALYKYAENLINTTSASAAILDKVAQAQIKSGHIKEAIATQKRAVELAKVEINDPKYVGRVFDYTISAYEEKVKQYQKALMDWSS